MRTKTLFPLIAVCLSVFVSGCATSPTETADTAEPKVSAAEDTYIPTGSHMRRRKGKQPSVSPTAVLSGEEASRQAKTDQLYPSGEQIINARNGP